MSENESEIAELKARLAALENKEPPSRESAAPNPFAHKSNGRAIVGGVIGVVVLLALVGMCSKASDPAPSASSLPYEPAPSAPVVQAWRYNTSTDPMTDKPTLIACVTSNDQVSLGAPYKATDADLCVRNSPRHGVDVFYRLNGSGQILCRSYDGCTVKMRYDQAPAINVGATEPSDNSTETVFLSGPRKVATRLTSAGQTRIEVSFFQNGSQSLTFNTKGLDLKKIGL